MSPRDRLLALAREAGATVVETPGAAIVVVPAAPAPKADGCEALVPLAEAAGLAATSVGVLRAAIRAGELPALGRQRDRAVRRSDLAAWIESRRVRPVAGVDDEDIARRVRRLAARHGAEAS